MPLKPIQKTRNKLAMIYGVGILTFTVILGTLTLLTRFLGHVNMS
jgi:hypothetical protein